MFVFFLAAATAAAAPNNTCTALSNQWIASEKELSDIYADGVADNSAPRATLREMRKANELTRANMVLTFMVQNHCPLPKSPPSDVTYMSSATQCRLDMMKGVGGTAVPESCKRETWKSMFEK